jgi:hypothetical protein
MSPVVHSVDEVFSQLSPDDEKILIALPYRVGLYVSFSDVTGGWEAQERELQSLTGILREFSEDFYKTEFAQKVLRECLQSRSQWPSLSQSVDGVPLEADRMIRMLGPMFIPEELNQFKDVLMDIALSVAMAFREDDDGNQEQDRPIVREILSRLGSILSEKDPLDHINISESERRAITMLARAIQYTKL